MNAHSLNVVLNALNGIGQMGQISNAEFYEAEDSFGVYGTPEHGKALAAFEKRVFSQSDEYLDNLNSLSDEDKIRVMQFAQHSCRFSLANVAAIAAETIASNALADELGL